MKRTACVWLAGLGLVAATLAQDAAPKPSAEQIKAAHKRMQKAIGAVGAMTRQLYQKDEELKALRQKGAQAAKARDDAIRELLAKSPETAEPAKQEAAVIGDLEKIQKQMAELQEKRKQLTAQSRELQKKLGRHRGKAMRDPSVAGPVKAARDAEKASQDTARAKLVATPEGKKAVEEMEAARKAYHELLPKKKQAPRKPGGKRGKPRKAKAAGASQ